MSSGRWSALSTCLKCAWTLADRPRVRRTVRDVPRNDTQQQPPQSPRLLDAGHDIKVISEADFLEPLALPATAPAEPAGPERAQQLPIRRHGPAGEAH